MVDKIVGYWKMEKDDNIDAYMKAAECGILFRQVAKTLSVYLEIIKHSEDEWEVNFLSAVRDNKIRFKLNERTEGVSHDGRPGWGLFWIEGNRLHSTEEPKKGKLGNKKFFEVLEDGRLYEYNEVTPNGVSMERWYVPHKK